MGTPVHRDYIGGVVSHKPLMAQSGTGTESTVLLKSEMLDVSLSRQHRRLAT